LQFRAFILLSNKEAAIDLWFEQVPPAVICRWRRKRGTQLKLLACLCISQDSNERGVHDVTKTRNSAIADKLREAFRGQSISPNIVPFDKSGMVFC